MVSNPYHFSRLGTTVSAQLTDGVDAPHTGLIKALSVYASGSYPVKTSTDFNITAATKSAINITSGRVVRDGELQAAITAGSSIAIGSTSAGKTYSLVVVDSSNAFAVRTTSTDNLVPEMSNFDIPIAVVLFTDDSSTMEFQYFTNRKESNTLSVAYANSNVYTEILEMKGNAGNVELTGSALTDISSLDAAADRLLVRDATNNQLKLVAPNSVGSTYSDANAISAVEGEATLALSGDVSIAAGKGLTVDTDSLVVDAANDRVGIGTNAPDSDLHITSSATGNIFILECTDAGTASGPDISMIRNSASPAANDFLGRLVFKGKDAGGNIDEYANIKTQLLDATAGSEDVAYYFQGLIAGTNRPFLGLKGTGGKNGSGAETCINEHGIDMDFRVEGNGQTEALFVQGSDGKVGINNNAPSVELDITGSGKFSSNLEIDGALNHDGSTAGFFGATPITKITVGNIAAPATINPDVPNSPTAAEITSTQAAILALENKLDAVIDALQALGLIA